MFEVLSTGNLAETYYKPLLSFLVLHKKKLFDMVRLKFVLVIRAPVLRRLRASKLLMLMLTRRLGKRSFVVELADYFFFLVLRNFCNILKNFSEKMSQKRFDIHQAKTEIKKSVVN